MGNAKRGGHCLKAIYSNLSELNIKLLIKYSGSVPGKLIEIKKLPENLLISPEGHKTSINSSIRHCFQQRTYWLEWYLVIPRESPGMMSLNVSLKVAIKHIPGDSKSRESPEEADIVWRLFIQILFR